MFFNILKDIFVLSLTNKSHIYEQIYFSFHEKSIFFMLLFILVFTSDKKIYQTKKTATVNSYNSVTSLHLYSAETCSLSCYNIISFTNTSTTLVCMTFIAQIRDITISKPNTADS